MCSKDKYYRKPLQNQKARYIIKTYTIYIKLNKTSALSFDVQCTFLMYPMMFPTEFLITTQSAWFPPDADAVPSKKSSKIS